MMDDNLAIFIPAQDDNKYHELGDLAPFGDTTLLEWKISQCKEFMKDENIYLSSSSDKVYEIAKEESVNFVRRGHHYEDFDKVLYDFAEKIAEDTILWTNVTSPFLDKETYIKMYKKFNQLEGCSLLVSSVERKEYSYFENSSLNFKDKLVPRETIEPVNFITNGCYIFKKDFLLKDGLLFDDKNTHLYNLDKLSSIEIKDILDYAIANDLISIYFNNLLKRG